MMKPGAHLYISILFPWHTHISVPLSATSPLVWVTAQLSPPGWNRSDQAWRHPSVSWPAVREVLLQEKFGYNISGRKKTPTTHLHLWGFSPQPEECKYQAAFTLPPTVWLIITFLIPVHTIHTALSYYGCAADMYKDWLDSQTQAKEIINRQLHFSENNFTMGTVVCGIEFVLKAVWSAFSLQKAFQLLS